MSLKTYNTRFRTSRRDVSQKGAETNFRLFHILHDVIQGIVFMHKNEIAHLDICDHNIMVNIPKESDAPVVAKVGFGYFNRSTKSRVG